MWSVFAADRLPAERDDLAEEVEQTLAGMSGKDVVVRGWYDVSGLRADADLMVWSEAQKRLSTSEPNKKEHEV